MADSNEKLFSDFPHVSTAEWMEKIQADLKGADFEKKLVWKTNEGFKVKPFYRAEDLEGLKTSNALPGEFPYLRGTKKNNVWHIRQTVAVADFAEANKKALDILNKGVDSLEFHIKGADIAAGNIETLLAGINAEAVELNFSTCVKHAAQLAEILVAYFKKQGYDLNKCEGSIECDPINRMLVRGKNMENIGATVASVVKALEPLPLYRGVCVDALSLNNAGAYIYQELGYALAWGSEYMNELMGEGLSAVDAAKSIKFKFGISSNYFMEIAKFRAARMLWAEIVKNYAGCDCREMKEAAKMKRIFKATFPEIYGLIELAKTGIKQKNRFACLLQSVESEIILHRCCKRIWDEGEHKVPVFTIHDSIATTSEYVKFVRNIMDEELTKAAAGVHPNFKTEVWSESNLKTNS